ncbi:MAG TPA: cupin domain-containing protein [Bacteroidetes bacterium]|nr:cupin domain-containing protein [Bacteroidota bacterium]
MFRSSTFKAINIKEKFKLFDDHWSPKVIGELNGQQVKIAKVKGEFVWHDHKGEDELFYIIKGTLKIAFRDKTVELKEGEMLIVPKGVEHKPVAEEEVWLMLLEPANIKHTGDVKHELTVEECEWLNG